MPTAFGVVEYARSHLIAQEAVITGLPVEAFVPAPHSGLQLSSPSHDLTGANAVMLDNDLGAPDMLMRGRCDPARAARGRRS